MQKLGTHMFYSRLFNNRSLCCISFIWRVIQSFPLFSRFSFFCAGEQSLRLAFLIEWLDVGEKKNRNQWTLVQMYISRKLYYKGRAQTFSLVALNSPPTEFYKIRVTCLRKTSIFFFTYLINLWKTVVGVVIKLEHVKHCLQFKSEGFLSQFWLILCTA